MFPGPLGGRYAIQSELASGGNGRIYLAEDLKLGRPVAVKVVVDAPHHASLEEGRRRLEREARVAGAINHPNVCAVSDVGRLEDGRPFLVMELLTGETLATRLERETSLPIPMALDFAYQMLGGIDAAHRRGIIHRDIKPENMFLTQLGPGKHLLKVLDFGTAQIPGMASPHGDELTKTGIVIGTMAYMSPEQLKGVRDFDTRTDVYSCGVVIYEMLVGKRPFGDLPNDRVGEAIAFSQPPSILRHLPHLPRHLARALDSSLSVDRARRPADAAAFLHLLHSPPPAAMQSTSPTNILTVERSSAPPGPQHVVIAGVRRIPTPDEWEVPTRPSNPGEAPPGMAPIAPTAISPPLAPGLPSAPSTLAPATVAAPPSAGDWDLPTRQSDPPNEWQLHTVESDRPMPLPKRPDEAKIADDAKVAADPNRARSKA